MTGSDIQRQNRERLRAGEANAGIIRNPLVLSILLEQWLNAYRDVDHTPNFNMGYLMNDELKREEWLIIIEALKEKAARV